MEQVLIQFMVDKALKQEVTEIYEAIGMDLPTALRMFMIRSKAVRGLPFPATMTSNIITHADAINVFNKLKTEASNVPKMSLDEINAEILLARR